jgi:hypothetical protein
VSTREHLARGLSRIETLPSAMPRTRVLFDDGPEGVAPERPTLVVHDARGATSGDLISVSGGRAGSGADP